MVRHNIHIYNNILAIWANLSSAGIWLLNSNHSFGHRGGCKPLQSVEMTFIPSRIDRCPQCDSAKIVFQKARAGSGRTNPKESNGLVQTPLRRLPERLHSGGDEFRVWNGI